MSDQRSEQVPFKKAQYANRKDIERALGIINARFNCLYSASRLWNKNDLIELSFCCVILHIMMINDGDDDYFDKNRNLNSISMHTIMEIALEQYADDTNVVDITDVGDGGHGVAVLL